MPENDKSILIIEDDDAVRTLMYRALTVNYKVHVAANAHAALGLLQTLPPVNLIISDVMMPGMTGVQLAKHLKGLEAYKNIPIIFLTAKAGALDVIQGINAGARHYVTKPFNMKDLLDKVAKSIK